MFFKHPVLFLLCACTFSLPALSAEQKTQEEFANLVSPPDFFSAQYKSALAEKLGFAFLEDMKPSILSSIPLFKDTNGENSKTNSRYPLEAQYWEPADFRRLLKGIRKITQEQDRQINAIFARHEVELRTLIGQHSYPSLVEKSQYAHTGVAILAKPEIIEWSKKNTAFMAKVMPLYAMGHIYRILSLSYEKSLVLTKEPGDEYINLDEIRTEIRAMLASPELRTLLSDEFDFDALKAEELALRQEAIRLFSPHALMAKPMEDYRMYIYGIYSRIVTLVEPETLPIQVKSRAQMKELGTLAWRASKPAHATDCMDIEEGLDMASLQKNTGNWKKITDKAGKPVTDSLNAMELVGDAFVWRCGVKQDLPTGIRVYETLVAALGEPSPASREHAGILCALGKFYGNGVGVKPDMKKARDFETLYSTRYQPGRTCSKTSIDPRDPWNSLQ